MYNICKFIYKYIDITVYYYNLISYYVKKHIDLNFIELINVNYLK